MSAPEPRVQVTRYTVNCVPEDSSPDADVFAIVVEYKGNGLWAATRYHRSLGKDGTWSYGTEWPPDNPGSREPVGDIEWDEYHAARDRWVADHRHNLDSALELAKAAAPHVRVNGMTPADALARIERLKEAGK